MVSTSPILSKPYPESSTGNSSAGLTDTPSRSRTVLLYSARFSRRAVILPEVPSEAVPGFGCCCPDTTCTQARQTPAALAPKYPRVLRVKTTSL
jgi:hypothetical protein